MEAIQACMMPMEGTFVFFKRFPSVTIHMKPLDSPCAAVQVSSFGQLRSDYCTFTGQSWQGTDHLSC